MLQQHKPLPQKLHEALDCFILLVSRSVVVFHQHSALKLPKQRKWTADSNHKIKQHIAVFGEILHRLQKPEGATGR